ncbi:hypothetical protein KAU19_00995 [Candidatus Parcubacteria bacterium]|nr:hypothetical protein [Candidatus Parcubacteria bacterium]
MKKIKKIKALSLGKILGIMYAIMGLIFGGLVTVFAILGNALFASKDNYGGVLFGIGAIIFLPIMYGFFGFVFGVISGWLYNLATKWVGGLEIEFEEN